MRFLILSAFLYFSALYYQDTLLVSKKQNHEKLLSTSKKVNYDYSKYINDSQDVFYIHSLKASIHQDALSVFLYSILDSLHSLPFVRNFLQKTYLTSDWISLTKSFYFSFYKDRSDFHFFWVTPLSETLLSKLDIVERQSFDQGKIAKIKWSIYDTLYIKQSKDKLQMLISSSKLVFTRRPRKINNKPYMHMKKDFFPFLKHLIKPKGLSWIEKSVDSCSLIKNVNGFSFKFLLKEDSNFYSSFLKMKNYEQIVNIEKNDLNFQVNLGQIFDLISKKDLSLLKLKGRKFLLRVVHLFSGKFSLKADLFGLNYPSFELTSDFKNIGSSARFISELEQYVKEKPMDLSKLNQDHYSISIPFSPIQFYLKREKKKIIISNVKMPNKEILKSNTKALVYLSLLSSKKEFFEPHVNRMIRSYHKKKLLTCFKNLEKRDGLFKYCPLGGNYSVEKNVLSCDIHGQDGASKLLSLVEEDKRKQLLKAILMKTNKLSLFVKTMDKSLEVLMSFD
ncbi:MAG: hypothetical protein COB02_00830 [Candidatus Cloacimonadota bacterium]|nr:MAG: hypothetical protein COB02_00830 [Candidatus Cloacimonadota bacterium]